MKQKQLSFKLLSLYLSMGAFATLSADTADSHTVAVENASAQEEDVVIQALLKRVLNQIDAIDLALEELAQAVNNNTIKVEDKKGLRHYISNLRTFINKVRKGELFELNKSNLEMILEINKTLLAHLNDSVSKEFKNIPEFTASTVARSQQLPLRGTLRAPFLAQQVDSNEQTLKLVRNRFSSVGTTPVNNLIKKAEKIDSHWGITNTIKRVLPYAGLGLYYTLINNENTLPTILRPLKRIVGGLPKKQTITEPRPQPQENHNKEDNAQVAQVEITSENAIAENAGASRAISETLQRIETGINNLRPQPVVTRETTVLEHGLLGTPAAWLGKFVTIEIKPFFTFTASSILAPIIKKDLEDIGSWFLTQGKKFYARLKGETYNNGSPIRSSRTLFSDIIGLDEAKQELSQIVDFFKNKETFDLTGISIDRGYLLAGQLDSGKLLAQAVAGEITKELKAQGKESSCGVYEIHASSLVTKGLKEVIEQAEKQAPCIIALDQLDWLSHQDNIEPKVLSETVNAMSSLLKNPKKQVFIIATAQNSLSVDNSFKEQGGLSITLTIDKPTEADRKEFFEKELKNRCLTTSEFNSDILAQQTEACSLSQLTSIIKRALIRALARHEKLSQNHLEQSIKEVKALTK